MSNTSNVIKPSHIAAAKLKVAIADRKGEKVADWIRNLAARNLSGSTVLDDQGDDGADSVPAPSPQPQADLPSTVGASAGSTVRNYQGEDGADSVPAPSAQPQAGSAARTGLADLRSALGVSLTDELLLRALTHRSYAYENGDLPTNERLEFLGDSVLGLIVTDTLFREYPDLPEGQLAKLRAAVVNIRALADVARGLHLDAYVRLGKIEEGTGGRDKSSILADTLEALLGAVYLDSGLEEAAALVHRLFDPVIAHSARLGAGLDWKTSLQELTAAGVLGVPEYHVVESGPEYEKSFRASVKIGGRIYGEGEGRSRKEAEQQAAEEAWTAIRDPADRDIGR
jgi:ribonuclease III